MSPFYDHEFLRIVQEETGRRMEILRWGETWWPAYRRFGVWRPLAEGFADDLDPVGDPHSLLEDRSLRVLIPESTISPIPTSRSYVKRVDADWRGTVSRNVRRDAAQTLRKLHVSVNPPGGWEDLLRLHKRRWRRRRMPGSFWGARRRVFARWLPIGIEAGKVRLSVARLDGVPVAALLGLMEADRFLYFQAGLDPDAPGSPGTALVADALDFCAESGRTRFDFLRGQESYKRRWNPEIEVPRGTLALQAPPTILWCEQVRQNLASAFAR